MLLLNEAFKPLLKLYGMEDMRVSVARQTVSISHKSVSSVFYLPSICFRSNTPTMKEISLAVTEGYSLFLSNKEFIKEHLTIYRKAIKTALPIILPTETYRIAKDYKKISYKDEMLNVSIKEDGKVHIYGDNISNLSKEGYTFNKVLYKQMFAVLTKYLKKLYLYDEAQKTINSKTIR